MGPFEMVVAIVAIGSIAGVLKSYFERRVVLDQQRDRSRDAALQEALRQVREEMAQLRQSTNDTILSFDSTLQRLGDRVQHLEQSALGTGATSGALPGAASRTAATGETPEARVTSSAS
jgi:ankyrin repeat protein